MLELWQWIFFIEVWITVLVAAVALWLMPKDFASALFRSEDEKQLAIRRIAEENKSASRDPLSWSVFCKALWNMNTQLVGHGLIMSLLSLTALSLFMVFTHPCCHAPSSPANRLSPRSSSRWTFLQSTLSSSPFRHTPSRNSLHQRLPHLRPLTKPWSCPPLYLRSENHWLFHPRYSQVHMRPVLRTLMFLTTIAANNCSPILLAWIVSNSAGTSY